VGPILAAGFRLIIPRQKGASLDAIFAFLDTLRNGVAQGATGHHFSLQNQ
jgi:hypothetical protein